MTSYIAAHQIRLTRLSNEETHILLRSRYGFFFRDKKQF